MSLTKEIQSKICKAEIQKGNIVAENFNYYFAGELDVISVSQSDYVYEFEVKVSRADFRADAKKTKWNYYDNPTAGFNCKYTPNYFYYVCPEGLIQVSEIKPYMGLIYYSPDGTLTTIQRAKIIHRHKHDLIKLLRKIATVNNWKAFFGAQKLTILNKEIKDKKQFADIIKNINNNRL